MTAPYRDDTDALEARHAQLSDELSSVKGKTKALDDLKATEVQLEREVAYLERRLAGRTARRSLPLLDRVTIASPCTASWDEMIGDDRSRFCAHCQKDVFNLSAMPREEAESFLRERAGEACVRLYKRADGTVLTSDCPVGVKRKRRRKAAVAAVGGSLLAVGAVLQVGSQSTLGKIQGAPLAIPSVEEVVMGGMGVASPPPEVAPPVPSATVSAPHRTMMGALPLNRLAPNPPAKPKPPGGANKPPLPSR